MNERIRELAKQAGAQGIVNRDFIDVEKFAELIVNECVGITDDAKTAYTKLRKDEININEKNIWAEGETASDAIKHKIKQHFGVE